MNKNKRMPNSANQTRSQKGNILLLILVCTSLIIVPLVLLISQGGLYIIDRERAKNAVDAAALLAANDISRVIIEDPHFGYISLSNYPPNGEGTLAGDGEPLPVTSINTLMGTIRQISILGQVIQNKTISNLAEMDRQSLHSSIDILNSTLKEATEKNSRENLLDNQGKKIEISKDVLEFLKSNSPPSMMLESVEIENGWLACPSRSSIALPRPAQYEHVEKDQSIDGEYRAFVDIPLEEKEFTFAALGKSSALVSVSGFKPADTKHINSIVKVSATFVRNSKFKNMLPFGVEAPNRIKIAAAAQPFTMDDTGPAGVMTLRFGGGNVSGLASWSDLLRKDNFHDRQVMSYQAVRGDYPLDPLAVMRPSMMDAAEGASEQFAEHLYYWLRNGHLRPSLSSIIDLLNQTFHARPNEIYAYEFNNSGNISRRVITKDPFPRGFTSEYQVSTTVDTGLNSGINPIIIFRNNVKRLGKNTGGKHAGQPIAGNPLNWCELAEYGGDDFIAGAVRKGRLATGLTLLNPGDKNSAFRGFDGKTICLQPRKSYYSGGLAVDIEIGGLPSAEPEPEPDAQTISQMRNARGGYSRH